jgi:hypothetical protein
MSAHTFVVAMLAMLSHSVKVLEGDGWMPGSLSARPGDAIYPVQS